MALHVLSFVLGLAVLWAGAQALVRGSVHLARSFGVSRLVVGLTLVAFGTSAPELFLDLTAAFQGASLLAFGDLVGSSIANGALILGLAALVRPLSVHSRLLRVEVPLAIAISLAVWAFAADGRVGRLEGAALLAFFLVFLAVSYGNLRAEARQVKSELESLSPADRRRGPALLYCAAGLAGLIAGAELMVRAAVGAATDMGISPAVIGLTVVAVGTSLPELAASIAGARRGEADLVTGNIVGSNIVNLSLILALVAVVSPFPVPRISLVFDLPVMVLFAVALVPIMLRGWKIDRREGALLLAGYAAFLLWRVLRAASDGGTT
jgi:cation:H+ antiporter